MEFWNKNSNVMYYRQIVRVRQIHDYDKHYSSLVSASPPFNLLIVPFVPFLLLLKSEKLNSILLYVCYLPVMLIGFSMFMLASFIHLPFAYILLVIHQFKIVINRGPLSFRSLITELLVFLFVLFFGAPYIFILQSVDVAYFLITMFSKTLQKKSHLSKSDNNGYLEIHPELFKLLVDKINSSTKEYINIKELISFFREKMKISSQIFKLVFDVSIRKKVVNDFVSEEAKYETVNYENEVWR